jgi:hypothetical protein
MPGKRLEIKVAPQGKDCRVLIDGELVEGITSFVIEANVREFTKIRIEGYYRGEQFSISGNLMEDDGGYYRGHELRESDLKRWTDANDRGSRDHDA